MQNARKTGHKRYSELLVGPLMRANRGQIMFAIKLGGGGGSQIKGRTEFKQIIENKECSTLIFS
jgi:hypothetical protein